MMKRIVVVLVLFVATSMAVGIAVAEDSDEIFATSTEAFAFAASRDDVRAVIRTEDNPPRWIVIRDTPGVIVLPRSTKLAAGQFFVYVDSYLAQAGTNCPTFDVRSAYRVAGHQVVGPQQPAIANTDGTAADVAAKVNAILAALRAHGLVAH